ncbi:Bgt-3848 [Blumeria graminis f. sp. tritici]|uniref:Bgt-3848 n=2 Tax=Blumeria graminis f. sp. tritici TaxID=62690 RepID=A0A061HBF8_BLUGR|nr:hypothetical protein BGT96224_3848 [Blumeria graminis f. sp. tritici 96224]VDB92523.1 Bgt-3848 [Blumeria graminis f. sp. tritici]
MSAADYLSSLLGRSLRVTTSDGRIFIGNFKSTDPDRNIILAQTYEYRLPPPPATAAEATAATSIVVAASSSRYLSLIVLPGPHIRRIELDEFASQCRPRLDERLDQPL